MQATELAPWQPAREVERDASSARAAAAMSAAAASAVLADPVTAIIPAAPAGMARCAAAAARPRLMVVDDRPEQVELLCALLGERYEASAAASIDGCLDAIGRSMPDAFVLDVRLRGESGLDLCRRLREMPALADKPMLMISADESRALEIACFDAGADDFMCKPVDVAVLHARLTRHLAIWRARRELERQAVTDSLTGIPNRQAFDRALSRCWADAQRSGRPLALLMVDVDRFKAINDLEGHQAGDEALARIARIVSHCAYRPQDLAARYGGEEFALLLPGAGPEAAMLVGARVERAVRKASMPHPLGGTLTVSVGAASLVPAAGGVPRLLVERADAALYRAKDAGRARVCD